MDDKSQTTLVIHYPNGNIQSIDLMSIVDERWGVVNIGRRTEQVANAIPLDADDTDPFQCSMDNTSGQWMLHNGQIRTECPKGLRKNRKTPCNGCMGCCVNIRPARPIYYWREPSVPTYLNGEPVTQEGTVLNRGDRITFGQILIEVG